MCIYIYVFNVAWGLLFPRRCSWRSLSSQSLLHCCNLCLGLLCKQGHKEEYVQLVHRKFLLLLPDGGAQIILYIYIWEQLRKHMTIQYHKRNSSKGFDTKAKFYTAKNWLDKHFGGLDFSCNSCSCFLGG